MSAQATFWAQKQRPSGGSSAKLVLLALGDIHNDHTGECRPKVATLAERCMLSERQVQRVLAGLERDGLIARQARHSKRGGYQIANGYKLFITAVAVVKKPCAARGDIGVRACATRGDAGVGAMGVTSTSPLEPDIYEPSSEEPAVGGKPASGVEAVAAPSCAPPPERDGCMARQVEQLTAAAVRGTRVWPVKRFKASQADLEAYRAMAEG